MICRMPIVGTTSSVGDTRVQLPGVHNVSRLSAQLMGQRTSCTTESHAKAVCRHRSGNVPDQSRSTQTAASCWCWYTAKQHAVAFRALATLGTAGIWMSSLVACSSMHI